MRKIVLAPSVIVILLLVASPTALGCVCVGMPGTPTPEQVRAALIKDFNEAFAVFSGEVTALDTFKVKFKVDNLWKGDFGDEISMPTGAKDNGDCTYTTTSCDYNFKLGEKYLVFAYGASPDEMQARECTRTRVLKYVEQEIKDLDEVRPHEKKNQNQSEKTLVPITAKSNKRLQRTGISVPLIDNLPLAQLSPGR